MTAAARLIGQHLRDVLGRSLVIENKAGADGLTATLAVMTMARNPVLPNVPTLNEIMMPGFDILAWAGMFGLGQHATGGGERDFG